jgi:WhiB family redox-sensing transcriptional regulator
MTTERDLAEYAARLAGRLNRIVDNLDRWERPEWEQWRQHGSCYGSFNPVFFDANERKQARRICADCPVRTACGQWAMSQNVPLGVFGGLAPRERQRQIRDGWRETG